MALARLTMQAGIATTLRAISGVENVFDNQPLAGDLKQITEKFVQADGEYVQYWRIRRIASNSLTAETNPGRVAQRHEVDWEHTFLIEMFFAYRDSEDHDGEAVMQALIDTVLFDFQPRRADAFGAFSANRPLFLLSVDNAEAETIAGTWCRFRLDLIEKQTGVVPT